MERNNDGDGVGDCGGGDNSTADNHEFVAGDRKKTQVNSQCGPEPSTSNLN